MNEPKAVEKWGKMIGFFVGVLLICVAFGASLGLGVRTYHYFVNTTCQEAK